MQRFALGVLAGMLIVFGAVYFYFAMGVAPVATSAPPMPFEKRFAHLALHARINREMPTQAPITADESNLVSGVHVYMEHCAVCHGLPGREQSAIAKGEFPRPPHLFRGKGVTDDEPGETYWKVANGIRLTGMPGFINQLSATEMWQVSLLLANADKLPDSVMSVLKGPQPDTPALRSANPNSPDGTRPELAATKRSANSDLRYGKLAFNGLTHHKRTCSGAHT